MSDPVIKEIKYSETLFNSLFDRIKEELIALCKSNELEFRGLWAFTYWEGANALQSIYFNHVNISTLSIEVIKEIKDTRLDCDYGSLGFSFTELKDKNSTHTKFLPETYNDAKGTVCYYDTIIGQQHASFVIIKNGQEILGVLDFFFEGELKNNCEEEIKLFFENKFYYAQSAYLTDFINAYKIRQFEDFIDLQKENTKIASKQPDFRNELNNATLYIQRLIAVSSKTPLMVIKHKNGNLLPELVSLNFDFIHSIIKHEHRFCPLTTEKNCFHFKEFDSFTVHTLKCDNPFLKGYYYDVFSSLGANLISQTVTLDSVEYTIKLVCKSTYNHKELDVISLMSDLNKMKSKFGKEIAFHKYRDERVYMLLDNTLKNDEDIYAFSMARKVTPHLKLSVKCKNGDDDCKNRNQCITTETPNRNLKQFLSPSTILPVQYENPTHELLEKLESEDKNIVHFKIINENETGFVFELKKLIARNPIHYLNILKPYLNGIAPKSSKIYNNLLLSFSGEDPLPDPPEKNNFAEVIKGKLNLIEALLQEEEIKVQARKAAISQVFARTGSHNLGSHVLAKMITSDSVSSGFSWDDEKYTPFKTSVNSVTNTVDKNTVVAHFNSYIRDRMDFLADLSTSTPLMEVSKALMSEVISGMDRNRILLNYISGVSAFKYAIQIRDCRICETRNCASPCDPITIGNEISKDIQVSMPNDVMGFHALYVIIENIIRNTAKHGRAVQPVDFTLEIRPCKEDNTLYEVWFYDSCKKEDGLTKEEREELNKIKGAEVKNSIKKIDLIVARQNQNINKEILDPQTNELRHGAWGIIEMKVAAAYLRKIQVETVDEPKYQVDQLETTKFCTEHQGEKIPNIIKAVNKEGCLGYVFHIMKPKELLVVDELGTLYKELNTKSKIDSKTKLEQLKENGIWVINTDANSPDAFNKNKVYPHPFMLVIPKKDFDKTIYLKSNELYKGNLPTRILVKDTKPIDFPDNRWIAWIEEFSLINDDNDIIGSDGIVEEIWKIWLQHRMSFLNITSIGSAEVNSFMPKIKFADTFNKQVLGNSGVEKPVFNFCIDHHGGDIDKAFNDKCFFDHYEANPSAVNNFLKKAKSEKISNSQLMDGIVTNLVIIDERIQAIYKEKYYPEIKLENHVSKDAAPFENKEILMKAGNIHIPDSNTIDLNQSSFKPDDECNLHKAVETIQTHSSLKKGIDLIVIHLGVIERILEAANKLKGKREVLDFIRNLTSKFDTRVVITSGRGKPDNLPDEVPFLTYSALSHYAIETPFKAFLNQALQSSRIFNKI